MSFHISVRAWRAGKVAAPRLVKCAKNQPFRTRTSTRRAKNFGRQEFLSGFHNATDLQVGELVFTVAT